MSALRVASMVMSCLAILISLWSLRSMAKVDRKLKEWEDE